MNARYNVTCPTCGATPGMPCTDMVWHLPMHDTHPTRTA